MKKANVDADLIVYQVGSACDGKWWEYQGVKYDKKGMLNKKLKQDGIENTDHILEGRTPESWEDTKKSLVSVVEDVLDNFECEYTLHLSGKGNFRYKYATILPYKGNRVGEKPFHYDAIRQFLVNNYSAKVSVGMEADDAIGLATNEESIVATRDKDLDCIPGLHFNWEKDEWYTVDEIEGYRNFFKQLLIGDSTDNILGLYNVGAKSAVVQRVLKAESLEELEREVYPEYTKRFGSYAPQFLRENAILLWILQNRKNPVAPERYWE